LFSWKEVGSKNSEIERCRRGKKSHLCSGRTGTVGGNKRTGKGPHPKKERPSKTAERKEQKLWKKTQSQLAKGEVIAGEG